jgi:lipopolysaccharide biosynthesis glycosyltransferase
MEDNYIAGAIEPYWTNRRGGDPYINGGVIMWNLEAYRGKMCDDVVRSLNTTHWQLTEQACLNELCRGKICVIHPSWNAGEWTQMLPDDQVRIRHRMASKGTWKTEPEVEMYSRMTWEEVFRK